MKFVDQIQVIVRAGHGGPGCVSFHREKYVEKGGPDGGDGGRGGNVYAEASNRVSTLGRFRTKNLYAARNGQPGMGRNRTGPDAEDLRLLVPVGTIIEDFETEETIADLNQPGKRVLLATGGIGGKGNAHFATSVNQTPGYAQPGMPGEERTVSLNLKLIADAGLVGLPNAGKSTLLSVVTANRPEIADYPFTTLEPNLGVIERSDSRRILLADIPGIIEGASKGAGLGLSFLRHIERVRAIIYVLDLTSVDPAAELGMLRLELAEYSKELLKRPSFILLNKMDEIEYDDSYAEELAQRIRALPEWKFEPSILFISARERKGLDLFLEKLFAIFPEQTAAERMLEKYEETNEPVSHHEFKLEEST